MRLQNRRFTLLFLIFMAGGLTSGCNLPVTFGYLMHSSENERTATLLKSPQIGDVYLVRIDYFSSYVYGDDDAAYGLLKVNHLTPTSLAVYSSLAANTNCNTAQQWLKQIPEGFAWDQNEEIIIPRQELIALFEKGMLIEAIRP